MNGLGALSRESTLIGATLLGSVAVGLIAATSGGGVVAMALPVAVAVGVVLLRKPVLGLFLFTAVIPIEAMAMVGGRSIAALIGMALVAIWAFQKVVHRDPLLPLVSPGLVQLALLLLALACLSLLWARYPQAGVRGIIVLGQLILLSALVFDLSVSWDRIAWVTRVLVLAGLLAALATAHQYYFGGVRRAGAGVTGGLNRTAITLVLILPFAFALFRSNGPMIWKAVGLSYVGVSAIAVASTLSRMNILLFPAVVMLNIFLMARTAGGRTRALLLGVLTLITVSFIPVDALRDRAETIMPYISQTVGTAEEEEAYSARGYLMRVGFAMFRDRPVFGSGYDNFRPQTAIYQWEVPGSPYEYLRTGRSPHSSYIALLVGLGIVGLILWLSIILVALRYVGRAWRSIRDPNSDRLFLVQALGIAIGLQLIYGFYGLGHQDKIVWLFLGLAVSVDILARRGTGGEGSERLVHVGTPWLRGREPTPTVSTSRPGARQAANLSGFSAEPGTGESEQWAGLQW
jgi:O-antigen ligase